MHNTLSRRLLAKVAVPLLQKGDKKAIKQLAAYLIATKRSHEAELLAKDIARELLVQQDTLLAEVTSAFPLQATSRQAVTAFLKRQTGAKTVELQESIDASLLGGMVVRTADQIADTSARRQLTQLANLTTGGN